MTAIWAWLHWQFAAEPVELVAVAILVLGLPVLAVWGVWLGRRTR
jgi:hypothetical protein